MGRLHSAHTSISSISCTAANPPTTFPPAHLGTVTLQAATALVLLLLLLLSSHSTVSRTSARRPAAPGPRPADSSFCRQLRRPDIADRFRLVHLAKSIYFPTNSKPPVRRIALNVQLTIRGHHRVLSWENTAYLRIGGGSLNFAIVFSLIFLRLIFYVREKEEEEIVKFCGGRSSC